MNIPLFLDKIPWGKLIKFSFVGGTAFALDFAIYFILTRYGHVPYLLSRVISIACAFAWNFLMNRNWTFQARDGAMSRQACRFIIVMGTTSLLNLVLMHIGVSILRLHDLLVIILVSLLIMGVNFFAHSRWSYRESS